MYYLSLPFSEINDFHFSQTDGLLSNVLGGIGHVALSAGAFVFDDDDDYLSGDNMNEKRMKIQVRRGIKIQDKLITMFISIFCDLL